MLIVTTENIAEHDTAQSTNEVFGAIVRSRGAVGDLTAGSRSVPGGEIPEHTRRIEQARQPALGQMQGNSGEIAASMSEFVAFGAAIVAQVRA